MQKNSRLLRQGDIVRTTVSTGEEVEDVVRSVSVILHLASGFDSVVPAGSLVEVLPQEDLSSIEEEAESGS